MCIRDRHNIMEPSLAHLPTVIGPRYNNSPEAEQLLQIRAGDTTIIAVSIYQDEAAMERASANRTKRMNSKKDHYVSVDMKVGSVVLNHSND